MPDAFINLSKLHRGLVLCTGPTGSGKSTTLAAFINCMLETQQRHILTIEDPIEFIFKHTEKSIIHQREVKRDTNSFSVAFLCLEILLCRGARPPSDVPAPD